MPQGYLEVSKINFKSIVCLEGIGYSMVIATVRLFQQNIKTSRQIFRGNISVLPLHGLVDEETLS